MKRKNEENLIKLVFGDMDPSEAARAKQLLAGDAEAEKLFAGYEEIREGLRQLHTPEHQLSTDRLREAILRDGLKREKPATNGWRWSLAPVAVAAAAMFLTLRFGSQTLQSPVIQPGGNDVAIDYGAPMREPSPSSMDAPNLSSAPIETPRTFSAPAPREAVVRPSTPAQSRQTSPRAETPRAEPAPSTVADASLVAKSSAPTLSPEAISNLAIDGALPAGAVAMSAELSEAQPIVLIGSESDESTGANRATEVSSASNVIVGG